MRRSTELVRMAFEFGSPQRLPRGEVWLNSELFERVGLPDTLEGHLSLRQQLGMDLLSLPLSSRERNSLSQGYRYFNLEEVRQAAGLSDLFVVVVLDGPFQKLTSKKGLMDVLKNWKESKAALIEECPRSVEAVRRLVDPCLTAGIKAFVVPDDLAYEQSTYFSPRDFEETLLPFYSAVVEDIHSGGAWALFHSCGNIRGLIPQLRSTGFDGFAACQTRLLEGFLTPKERSTVILGGIEPEHLESDEFDERRQEEFRSSVGALSRTGGFILCSSCGLYKPEFLHRIKLLYELVEEVPL